MKLELETRRQQEEIERAQQEAQRLAAALNEERVRQERRMHEMWERERQEAERAAAEHQRQVWELENRIREAAAAAAHQDAIRHFHAVENDFFGNFGRVLDSIFRW